MTEQAPMDLELLFRGSSQPDPTIRLDQIKIFLSDEDCHRCLGFREKILDIEEYIRHLKKLKYKGQEKQMQEIEEMVAVHNLWIKRAEPKPVSYHFTRFALKNRLLGHVADRAKRVEILNTKAPPISQVLTPGPSIHKRMADGERPVSPDPFHYTRAMADVRLQQNSVAVTRRGLQGTDQEYYLKEPNNLNGPYMPDLMETAQDVQDVLATLNRVVKKLDIISKQGTHPMIKKLLDKINQIKDSPFDVTPIAPRSDWTIANNDIDQILALIDLNDIGITESELCEDGSVVGGRFQDAAIRHAERIQYLNEVLRRIRFNPKFLTVEKIPAIFPWGVSPDGIGKPILAKIAEPLATPGLDLDEITAARLLQEQIVLESCNNHGSRQPDFAKIWAFAPEEKPKDFFALNRWPPELQSKTRQDEIKSSGPHPRRKRRHLPGRILEALENEYIIKPRENVTTIQVNGKTFYPFGETLEDQHILSRELEKDLEHVLKNANDLYRYNEIRAPEPEIERRFNSPDNTSDRRTEDSSPTSQIHAIAERIRQIKHMGLGGRLGLDRSARQTGKPSPNLLEDYFSDTSSEDSLTAQPS